MARYVLKTTIIILAVAAVAACGGHGSVTEVLRGNLAYSRGDYQNALVHYMVAVENAPSDAWTRFNIGNVYYALGEHEAALEVWHDARRAIEEVDNAGASQLSLIYATSYNRGVLLYQQGQYEAAYNELRYALSVNSRSSDAKANLELALSKLQAADAVSANAAADGNEASPGAAGGVSAAPPDDPGDDGPGEQTLRILEYVRRKETQQWFANREIESQDQPQDW
ncbi:MAG: tetratricopeptide repeat protein [Spirochaetales bacterium]|nr:tetratricopeptide repeat protein [Spirochaetales bacterium]